MDAPQGTIIAYATSPGEVADDGKGRNSPFALALLSNLPQPGITVLEALNKAGMAVMTETGKTGRNRFPGCRVLQFLNFTWLIRSRRLARLLCAPGQTCRLQAEIFQITMNVSSNGQPPGRNGMPGRQRWIRIMPR